MPIHCRSQLAVGLVFIFLLVGCAERHVVPIQPAIQNTAPPAYKLPGNVAVVFAHGTKAYRYSGKPISLKGHLHKYDFDVGLPLCTALLRSVNSAYQRAVETASMPRAGQYPYVVVFSLQKSQIDLSFEESLFKPSARASSTLAVSVDLLNGKTMTSLHSSTANGRSFLIRPLGEASSREAEQVFAAAIEASIQQLSDNAGAVLAQWAAEKPPSL